MIIAYGDKAKGALEAARGDLDGNAYKLASGSIRWSLNDLQGAARNYRRTYDSARDKARIAIEYYAVHRDSLDLREVHFPTHGRSLEISPRGAVQRALAKYAQYCISLNNSEEFAAITETHRWSIKLPTIAQLTAAAKLGPEKVRFVTDDSDGVLILLAETQVMEAMTKGKVKSSRPSAYARLIDVTQKLTYCN